MNLLTTLARVAAVANSTKLKGDKALYLALRTVAFQLETRNPGIYSECGYSTPLGE